MSPSKKKKKKDGAASRERRVGIPGWSGPSSSRSASVSASPLHLGRFSRHDCTLWQHIALVALTQRIRKSYRGYVDDYLTTTEKSSWTSWGLSRRYLTSPR